MSDPWPFDGDDDHLRDDPELRNGREFVDRYDEEAVEDRKRTPWIRPLFQDPTDAWAQDQL